MSPTLAASQLSPFLSTQLRIIRHYQMIVSVLIVFVLSSRSCDLVLTEWTPITKEYVLNNKVDEGPIYIAQKVYSERAVWEFAEKHPDVEVASSRSFLIVVFLPAHASRPYSSTSLLLRAFRCWL